jgi:aspartyl-tRNA(Asn)/glutamyl-tRNA(Gln) amidotransferase subunit B
MANQYQVVIGMEIHAQLKTRTKMFCACAVSFGAPANTHVCPICMGLPGTLPTVNAQAIALAMRASLALNCQIRQKSTFARKHYFYPDLPKGYQITQYQEPLAYNGFIDINDTKIRIRRLHLEEDSGKSIHADNESLVDFNRCGVPLIEIVTEPDITSPDQAVQYLHELRQILSYLDVSDCDMEKGHFRCEPNISLRPVGQQQFGVRTELKNLNSLRNVRDGLEFEINRQTELLNKGKTVRQETLFWDEQTGQAGTMRSKEESEDYRYFPEPDLPVMTISEQLINKTKSELPLLPAQRKQYLIQTYNISSQIAEIIIQTKEFADYFDATVKHCSNAKLVANWLLTEVRAVLNQQNIPITDFTIAPPQLAELLNMLNENKITGKNAKQIFEQMVTTDKSAQEIAKTQNLLTIEDDTLLNQIVQEVVRENPDIVKKYRQGKTSVIGYLTGLVLKKSQGKLNPEKINQTIKKYLQS